VAGSALESFLFLRVFGEGTGRGLWGWGLGFVASWVMKEGIFNEEGKSDASDGIMKGTERGPDGKLRY
jgi:hypothetical protein